MTSSPRTTPLPRRALLTLAAGLTLSAAGCSAGIHPGARTDAAASGALAAPSRTSTPSALPLAVLTGQHRLQLTLTSARRLPHGAVTLRGTLKNTGTALVIVPAELRGNETAVLRNGPSLAGATLVDFTAGKRYYVLRDTDARPLTTTGLSQLNPGETVPVFLQFPAPPPSTTQVDFELPLFDSATITLAK
ncbi:hypothetical protein [Streptomyces sp. NPDC059378]|uniref:hypothetical protein n=1 Tax=Streptomyces sp. NPDC059378 TaxID=3346815 RepID=UPI0036954697